MTNEISGRLCVLTKWNQSHLEILYKWRNSNDYIEFCSLRKVSSSFEEFKSEFYRDLSTDRQDQFIIVKKSDSTPVGTIFLYGLNTYHRNAFITTFIDEDSQNFGYGVEAFTMMCMFSFKKYNLHKVIVDVYSINSEALKMLRACGFKEEGYFSEHRKDTKGDWLDVIRLSLFAKDTSAMNAFVKKITNT